jgi:NAD(P) transhydrogenase
MAQYDYDAVVIGSGPAGERGAVTAALLGKRVAVVERQSQVGGACINTGTVPSKTLRESALFFSGIEQRGLYGVMPRVPGKLTVPRFMYRTRRVIESELQLIRRGLGRHHVELITGSASLFDPHTVRVTAADGALRELTAAYLLIATGSSPHRPAHVPFDDNQVYDSDTILSLDRMPATMTVLGAGVIGCEYACIFAALGVQVTLLEGKAEILPFVDNEITARLMDRMAQLKIEVLLREELATVEVVSDQVVRTTLKSGRIVEAEKFLFSAGRSGNVRGLGLESAGITPNERGLIPVNEMYQTDLPNIYAAGDVIGFPALASTSMEQGRLALMHAFDPACRERLSPLLPYGIYTIPEVSFAGETEETLRDKRIDYLAGRASYGGTARGQIIGDPQGLLKLLFARADQKLLGVHCVGEDATELIHVGMMVMQFGGGLDCLFNTVFNFPTLAELYKHAAYDALGYGRAAPAADAL